MVFFLRGEEEFLSRQKLNEIIAKYKEANKSGLNFHRFDFAAADFKDFSAAVESISMFPEKKLAVLENSFKNPEAETLMAGFLNRSGLFEDGDVFLIFYETGKIPEKSELAAVLAKKAKCQEFKKLESGALLRWINKTAEEKGGKLGEGVAGLFSLHFKNDLRRISQELEKLVCYDKKITKENFYLLSSVPFEANSFQFIDALASGDKGESISLLEKCFESGVKEVMIVGIIASHFRALAKIKSRLGKDKTTDGIAKAAGLHPFVVKKSLAAAKIFSEDSLKKIHSLILRTDRALKSGKTDPKAALNLLVLDILASRAAVSGESKRPFGG